jgi:hypothetical protein
MVIVQRHGNIVSGRYLAQQPADCLVLVGPGTVPAHARHGAIFAIKVRMGFITIIVQEDGY